MSKEKLTKEDVLHIAELVNLTLSEEEIERLSTMLSKTLDYIKVLDELDTKNVPEIYQVTGQTNVFQKDNDKPQTLSQEQALKNASEKVDGYFAIKAIFDR